ncbi:hypothetical protein OIDMADRAFT_135861, partial [Oidiodendron maius Zn]
VESRIERLESVLAASGIDPNSVAEADGAAAENADDLPQNVVDRLTTLLISEEGASSFLGASSGLSLFSPQGLQWISESTGSNDLSEFISTLSKTNEGPWKVNNMDLWHSMLPSQREPLPPKEIADILVECFFDTFNNVFPLFDRTTFYDAYSHQYAQQPIGGSAWYACLNVVLCLGSVFWHAHIHSKDHHLKTEISGFTEEKCWKYFRNACSCLTDLMFKDCNLMAVQAIIGMAFMQQTTLDPQTFYILIAAAGRLAHGIGLHRKLDHFGLSEAEANQRRNVFWIVYFLDKTTALRLGHPSVMTDDDIGVDLPSERKMHETTPNGTKIFDIFRSHAELAVLESRIYTELYSEKARNRPHNERLISVGRLDIALLEWKKRLPVEIRPEEPIQCSREQVIPVIVLHFEYFNCLTTVHRISNSGSWTDQRARKNPLSANKRHLSPRIYASHSICLSAARATIRLLNMVDLESGTPRDHIIRMALYYPLSSCLILFANLLQNPKDPYASSDIDLMDIVRSFLSPNALGSTPLNANLTIKIFTELTNVARKFVDKVTLQGLNKAKRTHEKDEGSGWQHLSVPSKEPVAMNDFHTAAEQLARTDVRVRNAYIKSFRSSFITLNQTHSPSPCYRLTSLRSMTLPLRLPTSPLSNQQQQMAPPSRPNLTSQLTQVCSPSPPHIFQVAEQGSNIPRVMICRC